MRQQLGIEFSKGKSNKMLILFHLAQLQLSFGGLELLCGIMRLKRTKPKPAINFLDIHLVNLVETYGKANVLKLYQITYRPNELSKRRTA